MKYLILIIILMSSCKKEAMREEKSTNPNIMVELLLEHDGCKIYRFFDSNFVYFTKCGETSNVVNCGKNCTRVQRNLK